MAEEIDWDARWETFSRDKWFIGNVGKDVHKKGWINRQKEELGLEVDQPYVCHYCGKPTCSEKMINMKHACFVCK